MWEADLGGYLTKMGVGISFLLLSGDCGRDDKSKHMHALETSQSLLLEFVTGTETDVVYKLETRR